MSKHPLLRGWSDYHKPPQLDVYRYAWRSPWVRAVLGGMFLANVLVILTFVLFGLGGW